MADTTLFDDTFTITSLNSQKYDRVSRITATSADNTTTLSLDLHTELFPVSVNEPLQLVLASSLSLSAPSSTANAASAAAKDEGAAAARDAWREVGAGGKSLADLFDYVAHGKVYRVEDSSEGDMVKVYVSFGGLLLFIEGPFKKLTGLRVDYVYLLIKK